MKSDYHTISHTPLPLRPTYAHLSYHVPNFCTFYCLEFFSSKDYLLFLNGLEIKLQNYFLPGFSFVYPLFKTLKMTLLNKYDNTTTTRNDI